MNGTTVLRCVVFLPFFAMVLLPTRLHAAGGDSGKFERVKKSSFGKLSDGTEIQQFTLHNSKGAFAKVITYGATLTELWMPDKSGKNADVVLDRKSTRLNSSHQIISYAVFCLKKKKRPSAARYRAQSCAAPPTSPPM